MMRIISDTIIGRRSLFIFGNMAICAVVVAIVVVPIVTLFADREEQIVTKTRALARLNAITAQASSLQSITADTSVQMRGDEFLSGPNENVISANLQARLKAIVETAGARSRAVQALPLKTSDQIRYSGSRIEIFGPLPSIHRAIHAIESAKPYFFITGATIRAPSPGSKAAMSEEPIIQAQLDIFGALQVSGREP